MSKTAVIYIYPKKKKKNRSYILETTEHENLTFSSIKKEWVHDHGREVLKKKKNEEGTFE